ncbi:MAG TPA: antitoxin [Candidatus Dormibacteraeota bacterium]|nr:antitoxin [Candidatus Dormibacteraeota bacterium]
MGKPLQIRDVPDDVLSALKERAKREGTSLASYALRVLALHVSRPTLAEVMARPRRGHGRIGRDDILRAIEEGRAERMPALDGTPQRPDSG